MAQQVPYMVYISEIDELMGNEYLFTSARSFTKILPEIMKELEGQYGQFKYSLGDKIDRVLTDVTCMEGMTKAALMEKAMTDDKLAQFIMGEHSFATYGKNQQARKEELEEGIDWEFWREVGSFLCEYSVISLVKTEAQILKDFKETGKKFLASTERSPLESFHIEFTLDIEPALEKLKEEVSSLYEYLQIVDGIEILRTRLSDLRVKKTISFYKNTRIFIF